MECKEGEKNILPPLVAKETTQQIVDPNDHNIADGCSETTATTPPPHSIIELEPCLDNQDTQSVDPLKAVDFPPIKDKCSDPCAEKSLDLMLKPTLDLTQHQDDLQLCPASCSRLMTDTEAALVAATNSNLPTNLLNEQHIVKQIDTQTQFNSLEIDTGDEPALSDSLPSIGSLVCRICHNADNPEQLVSPCLCKGSLTYVHIHCLERWISTSRCTTCELCQFTYNTEQTLRYTCLQSLRLWYSRAVSRRALQEDCQMFSLLTLVAFGIMGTLLVGMQYYALHTQAWGLSKLWTKSWMLFFLFITATVYFANVYMLIKSQLTPWYRWWQSARDIKLILENRRPFRQPNKMFRHDATSSISMFTHPDIQDTDYQQETQQQQQQAEQQSPPAAPPPPPLPQVPLQACPGPNSTLGNYLEWHDVMLASQSNSQNPQMGNEPTARPTAIRKSTVTTISIPTKLGLDLL